MYCGNQAGNARSCSEHATKRPIPAFKAVAQSRLSPVLGNALPGISFKSPMPQMNGNIGSKAMRKPSNFVVILACRLELMLWKRLLGACCEIVGRRA